MKQAASQWLLVVATLLLCSSTSAIIPKKHWSEIGYEAFNRDDDDEAKVVTSARKAATPAKSGGGITRAILGVGVASALATVGGKKLGEEKPELALLDALRKPVVAVGPPPLKISTDGASIPSHVFNLVKGIVGVGVLSLPAGVAAFGNAPSAVIPATVLISLIGVLSAFGFYLIGKVCAYTGAKSFREAWAKSVGEGSSWIPAWTVTFKTFFACLAFSMVLADTFASIVGSARNDTLLTITGLILLPLCLKKDLKSLAPFSLLGVIGMAYTSLAMTVRFFDGSYALGAESQGKFIESIESFLRPKFGNAGMESVFSPNALMLVCMLSTAYMAHFNAPKFYLELKNNTLQRFGSVVNYGFGLSILLMGFISALGFLTFGGSSAGVVLNNYSSDDSLMQLSRVAVGVSLIFSYPLAFTGCRDGFMDLFNIPTDKRTPTTTNFVTLAVLGIITSLALKLRDITIVLSFGGATLGNALTYVYPAMMYKAVVSKQGRKGENFMVRLSMLSAVVGIVMGALGTMMALKEL